MGRCRFHLGKTKDALNMNTSPTTSPALHPQPRSRSRSVKARQGSDNPAVKKLHEALALAKQADRDGHEAIVFADQFTVRETLLEIERLTDQIQNPHAYAH